MNLRHSPIKPLQVWAAQQPCYPQTLGPQTEVESLLQPVRKGISVLLSIFTKAKPVVTATQTDFQVPQHPVDPAAGVDLIRSVQRASPCVMACISLWCTRHAFG